MFTVLPSWWDDEAAETPAGYAEGLMHLSRHLGIDISKLRDEQAKLSLAGGVPSKLKRSRKASDGDVALARDFAAQVARLIVLGTTEQRDLELGKSATDVRQHILGQDASCVSLGNLLDYCWSVNIPVIHISVFPPRAKRMHALAARVDGRAAIVVCRQQKQNAWLLFDLAHELGHIVLGHISRNEVLVDEVVDPDSGDEEENAANRFALELLTGSQLRLQASGRWLNAMQLANEALRLQRERQIDPGHAVLNYAHSMGPTFFAVANAALKLLDSNPDAPGLIRQKLASDLDWANLPKDSSEFVSRVAALELPSPDSFSRSKAASPYFCFDWGTRFPRVPRLNVAVSRTKMS